MAETLADLIAKKSAELDALGFCQWGYRTPEEAKAMADDFKYMRRSHLSDGEVEDLHAEITRLRRQNQELREALRPFLDEMPPGPENDDELFVVGVTGEHHRRARALLASQEEKQDGQS